MHYGVAVSGPEIVPKESWEKEFTVSQSIPSSARKEPAKALLLFVEMLSLTSPLSVLDAGCGNGRNAVYLAKRGCQVTALDFADSAIKETKRRILEEGLSESVSLVQHSLVESVPFPDGSFDFTLDAYTFCHFLRQDIGLKFWKDMMRVTRKGGHLLSIVFSPEDEYYARFLKDSPNGSVVCDPTNGIWKRLYSENEIKEFFKSIFDLKYFARFEFSDLVLGSSYRRVVLISVLQKKAR